MAAINIEKLEFGYGRNLVLSDLNMSVPKGAIYGFLGANGSGKSTTIRNIVGLLKPFAGKISVLGKEVNESLAINSKIGTLIETPSLYSHLTAKENLKIVCQYQKCAYDRIDAVLNQIGLNEVEKKKASEYSLGMKQRLGLGMALMHDPEILILDEPTIGLDPNGIKDMRKYIQELSASGKTILLSSHHLEEVQKIATHIGILNSGNLLFEGTTGELDALRKKNQAVVIHCGQPDQALKLLKQFNPEKMGEGRLQINLDNEVDTADIIRTLTKANIDVYELTKQRNNLENIFLDLTENKNR